MYLVFPLNAGIFYLNFFDCFGFFGVIFNWTRFYMGAYGGGGRKGWILTTDVSSDRPMGSDHPSNPNFSHKDFLKKIVI
jgi:hypothetical protein